MARVRHRNVTSTVLAFRREERVASFSEIRRLAEPVDNASGPAGESFPATKRIRVVTPYSHRGRGRRDPATCHRECTSRFSSRQAPPVCPYGLGSWTFRKQSVRPELRTRTDSLWVRREHRRLAVNVWPAVFRNGCVQEGQLPLEWSASFVGNDCEQIFDHCPELANELDRTRSGLANLVKGKSHVAFPGDLAHAKPKHAGVVGVLTGREWASRQLPQPIMQAIDGLHRGGGVERMDEASFGNVHEHAEAVGEILVHGSLGADRDCRRHLSAVESFGVPMYFN